MFANVLFENYVVRSAIFVAVFSLFIASLVTMSPVHAASTDDASCDAYGDEIVTISVKPNRKAPVVSEVDGFEVTVTPAGSRHQARHQRQFSWSASQVPVVMLVASPVSVEASIPTETSGVIAAAHPNKKAAAVLPIKNVTFCFELVPVNQSPVAYDDEIWVSEGFSVTFSPEDNDIDADSDILIVTEVSQPLFGEAILAADGVVSYIPDTGFSGEDSFGYVVSDGLTSAYATIHVTVIPVAAEPSRPVDDQVSTFQNVSVAFDAFANDGLGLQMQSFAPPSHGWLSFNGVTFTYHPDSDFVGQDSFNYTVTDGMSMFTATVTIDVGL